MILPNNKLPEWCSFENLYKGMKKSCKNVRWKSSVTEFERYGLSNVQELIDELQNGTYKISKYYEFNICEPKPRHIMATRLRDRVLQRSFCDNYFYDIITRSFIYDNCACQKGKGTKFATDRLKKHLQDFYHKNRNNNGWILKCDIHHYFESINHERLFNLLKPIVTDNFSQKFIFNIIKSFGNVGLGLGSQVSQLLALKYLDELDHIIKEDWQIKYYIRYMDDFVIIHNNKELLKEIIKFLKIYLSSIGLELNAKTTLQPLYIGIKFMKWHYKLTIDGKVLMVPDKHEIAKKKKRIKTMVGKAVNKIMTVEQVKQSVFDMTTHLKQGNSFKAVKDLEFTLNSELYRVGLC